MLNLTTVTDQHSSQGTEISRQPTKLHTPIGVNLTTVGVNLTIIADQHSSPGTKLGQHTYQTKRIDQYWTQRLFSHGTELSRHTYRTTSTNQCDLTTVGVNLTTADDQHSSPGTKISWHTYQTKHTDRCWT